MDYLEKFYDRAIDWVVRFGPKLIAAILILIVGIWLIRVFNRWVKRILGNKTIDPTLRTFLQNLLAIILQVLLIITVMQILGVEMSVFAALIAAFGVAIGLALSGTMQNFASGVLILFLKPYRVGDNVTAQGQTGTVSSIQLFYTVITTFDNKTVIVPNSKLSNEVIINLSKEGKRRIDIDMKFPYSVDFNKIKEQIFKSLANVKNIAKDPGPRIGINTIEADSYHLILNLWTDAHGFEDTRLYVQEKLMNDFRNSDTKLPGMV